MLTFLFTGIGISDSDMALASVVGIGIRRREAARSREGRLVLAAPPEGLRLLFSRLLEKP